MAGQVGRGTLVWTDTPETAAVAAAVKTQEPAVLEVLEVFPLPVVVVAVLEPLLVVLAAQVAVAKSEFGSFKK